MSVMTDMRSRFLDVENEVILIISKQLDEYQLGNIRNRYPEDTELHRIHRHEINDVNSATFEIAPGTTENCAGGTLGGYFSKEELREKFNNEDRYKPLTRVDDKLHRVNTGDPSVSGEVKELQKE